MSETDPYEVHFTAAIGYVALPFVRVCTAFDCELPHPWWFYWIKFGKNLTASPHGDDGDWVESPDGKRLVPGNHQSDSQNEQG